MSSEDLTITHFKNLISSLSSLVSPLVCLAGNPGLNHSQTRCNVYCVGKQCKYTSPRLKLSQNYDTSSKIHAHSNPSFIINTNPRILYNQISNISNKNTSYICLLSHILIFIWYIADNIIWFVFLDQ